MLGALVLMTTGATAQTSPLPKLKLYPYSTGYTFPLGIENAGDNRLFIVEKGGQIIICSTRGNKNPVPFLDISDRINASGGEQGLLGLAFDPNFQENGYFYVNYTNLQGDTHISRFEVSDHDPDIADENSEVVLLTAGQPFTNHNGGQLKFGPDNYLYIALGDGGSAGDPFNNAQNPGTFLGKMLRIDVSAGSNGKMYSIPATNPFVGVAGYLEEIWSTGLRNPFRFSFDRLNGDMWIADVGQDKWEEINFQPSTSDGGENYGWSCWEGNHLFKSDCDANATPPTFPIAEYPHSVDPCSGSIVGGHVYRGKLFSKMYGKYFYADYCKGFIGTVFKANGVWVNKTLATLDPFSYTSFGENKIGELFLADASQGIIYLVYDASEVPPLSFLDERLPKDKATEVTIFPNPANEQFSVRLTAEKMETYQLRVLNMWGEEVFSESRQAQPGLNEWKFSSANVKKGAWVLQIENSTGVVNKRLLVE